MQELITNTNSCDIGNSREVGITNIATADLDKLKIAYTATPYCKICEINLNYGSNRFNLPTNYSQ